MTDAHASAPVADAERVVAALALDPEEVAEARRAIEARVAQLDGYVMPTGERVPGELLSAGVGAFRESNPQTRARVEALSLELGALTKRYAPELKVLNAKLAALDDERACLTGAALHDPAARLRLRELERDTETLAQQARMLDAAEAGSARAERARQQRARDAEVEDLRAEVVEQERHVVDALAEVGVLLDQLAGVVGEAVDLAEAHRRTLGLLGEHGALGSSSAWVALPSGRLRVALHVAEGLTRRLRGVAGVEGRAHSEGSYQLMHFVSRL